MNRTIPNGIQNLNSKAHIPAVHKYKSNYYCPETQQSSQEIPQFPFPRPYVCILHSTKNLPHHQTQTCPLLDAQRGSTY